MIETILIGAGSAVVLAPFKYYLGFLCKKVHQAKVRRLPKPDYETIQALEESEFGQVYTKKPKTGKTLSNGARVVTEQGKRRVLVNTYPGTWNRYTAKVEKRSKHYGWNDNDDSYLEHWCTFRSRWEGQAVRRAVRDMQRHQRSDARYEASSASPGDCTMRF